MPSHTATVRYLAYRIHRSTAQRKIHTGAPIAAMAKTNPCGGLLFEPE